MSKNIKQDIRLQTNTSAVDWIKAFMPVITAGATIVAGVFCINKIVNKQTQQQTQVVIEPRDGDIIVKDGDDYKLLQLIGKDDIVLPTKIQEIQLKAKDSDKSMRADVGNVNNEDWSNRDSFKYVINNVHINTNKLFNLLETIKSIDIYCDFYIEKNISSYWECMDYVFTENLYSNDNEGVVSEHNNIVSKYEYVTKELNDGFEWCKIRLVIKYNIDSKEVIDTISTDWIATTQDFIV